jgi:hypothetical protein
LRFTVDAGSAGVAAVLVCGAKVRVAVAVAPFVAFEVLNVIGAMMFIEMLAAMRILAAPPIVTVEVVVNVPPEVFVAMEPGTRADEDASGKPLWAIVAIRRAIVGRIVEVAIRALGRRPDFDRDLCVYLLGYGRKAESGDDQQQ